MREPKPRQVEHLWDPTANQMQGRTDMQSICLQGGKGLVI